MAKRRTQQPVDPPTEVEGDGGKVLRVTIDAEISRRVKVIATSLDVSVPDWVNNQLRPIVEAEWPATARRLGMIE